MVLGYGGVKYLGVAKVVGGDWVWGGLGQVGVGGVFPGAIVHGVFGGGPGFCVGWRSVVGAWFLVFGGFLLLLAGF